MNRHRARHHQPPRRHGGLMFTGGVRQQVGAQQGPPVPEGYDYSSDPVLQRIRALAQQSVAAAEAAAQAARSQALIRFGFDSNMAGLYGDANTAGAAQANPTSTLALLARRHEQRARSLDENLGARHNLFYSSYRGQQLQNEGRQYLGEQQSAHDALQTLLGRISEGLVSARSGAQEEVSRGEEDAYNRALQFGNRYGYPTPPPRRRRPRRRR